ncbi:hypothetical protein AKO1_002678 [Acrasis kona]|uniref:Uncharacterized protein n=1 Tax=Acrasis kona TaxID=1008807 RepID=A0AAW2ZQ00_9EUKA
MNGSLRRLMETTSEERDAQIWSDIKENKIEKEEVLPTLKALLKEKAEGGNVLWNMLFSQFYHTVEDQGFELLRLFVSQLLENSKKYLCNYGDQLKSNLLNMLMCLMESCLVDDELTDENVPIFTVCCRICRRLNISHMNDMHIDHFDFDRLVAILVRASKFPMNVSDQVLPGASDYRCRNHCFKVLRTLKDHTTMWLEPRMPQTVTMKCSWNYTEVILSVFMQIGCTPVLPADHFISIYNSNTHPLLKCTAINMMTYYMTYTSKDSCTIEQLEQFRIANENALQEQDSRVNTSALVFFKHYFDIFETTEQTSTQLCSDVADKVISFSERQIPKIIRDEKTFEFSALVDCLVSCFVINEKRLLVLNLFKTQIIDVFLKQPFCLNIELFNVLLSFCLDVIRDFDIMYMDMMMPCLTFSLQKIKNAQLQGEEVDDHFLITEFLFETIEKIPTEGFEEAIGKEHFNLIKDICKHGVTQESTCMNFIYLMVILLSEKMLTSSILPEDIEEKKKAINRLITHAVSCTRDLKYRDDIVFGRPFILATNAMCAMNALLSQYDRDLVIYDVFMSRVDDIMICFNPINELELSSSSEYIINGMHNHIVLFSIMCTLRPEKTVALFVVNGMLAMAAVVWGRFCHADSKERGFCFDALVLMTEYLCKLDQRFIYFSALWVEFENDLFELDAYRRVSFRRIFNQFSARIYDNEYERKEGRQAVLELCGIETLPRFHPLSDVQPTEQTIIINFG